MSEQADFTDDICTHTDCDCNCMTAKEKRIQQMIARLKEELGKANEKLWNAYDENHRLKEDIVHDGQGNMVWKICKELEKERDRLKAALEQISGNTCQCQDDYEHYEFCSVGIAKNALKLHPAPKEPS